MRMKASFELENPEQMDATLTMTMRLDDWRSLSEQLNGDFPSWQLSSTIVDLLMEANKTFYKRDNND